MKKWTVRTAVLAALLLAAALPAAAIPYCWNCTCAHACWAQCSTGSGLDTCANWRCDAYCLPNQFRDASQSDLFAEPVAEGCELTEEALFAEAPVVAPAATVGEEPAQAPVADPTPRPAF